MSTGVEKTEQFLLYINKILASLASEKITDEDDAKISQVMYDFAPALLAVQVLEMGVSEFAKQQFILGMLWERYKHSEDDAGLNDLLHDVKI